MNSLASTRFLAFLALFALRMAEKKVDFIDASSTAWMLEHDVEKAFAF